MEFAPTVMISSKCESRQGLDLPLGITFCERDKASQVVAAIDRRPGPPGIEDVPRAFALAAAAAVATMMIDSPFTCATHSRDHASIPASQSSSNGLSCRYILAVPSVRTLGSLIRLLEGIMRRALHPTFRFDPRTLAEAPIKVGFAFILSRVAAELALFAGVGFLFFAVNDLIVDLIYFARRIWRSLRVYRRHRRAFASYYCSIKTGPLCHLHSRLG
jgi:hypothetical protein